jgi:hypothetical protein
MRRLSKTVQSRRAVRARHQNTAALSTVSRKLAPLNTRNRGGKRDARLPFVPPEDWHEPVESGQGYRFVVQEPGAGYCHPVTAEQVRDRLSQLPAALVAPLEIIQFSRMTRKKRSFPCYGMQWGSAIYLYPIESGLVEYYSRPPRPCHVNEAAMFGGRWVQESSDEWKLVWTERTIQDFYLNNILIHELGHLLDERNSSYADRERYAEWFATHYGYLPTQRRRTRGDRVFRRHHAV